ncbi:MAG: amino acid ABC transporter permease [Hydrogenophaga sp.]|uniref:amino acid ABC transporter permease n=1 Tax=Hydrogenophaga sp. TaxID=1904254 RepID=UPI00271A2D88|nr:amino acid ABC transporter permease [Hydrogenophaga sp.]MDO8888895.1 amino acid ABC transporter permease [Hydrogenophaga sp.]MDP2250065.1 amino acid ABC transporter permease [Hydrogenophaga sp.]MDZ4130321.1 amino acid ABC transporter permease [Hydrogenophaga sp.]
MTSVTKPPRPAWSWRSRAARGLIYQALALVLIGLGVWFLAYNTQENMRIRGIQSGFDFLGASAGFDIGETLINYDPSETYGKAIWVGVLNTLRVAVIGIVLTTILGVLLGVGRFSRNGLVRGICYGYVELFRNVPILLQMLMWYLFFVEVLPPPGEAWNLGDLFYLSKDGFAFPRPMQGEGWLLVLAGLVAGVLLSWVWRRWALREFEKTGRLRKPLWPTLAIIIAGTIAGWLAGGMPTQWAVPEAGRFMIEGGGSVSPEFMAVLISLTFYTSAFVAEVVRGGIQSVSLGQKEAAAALGLAPKQTMNLVVLPQAMRVIIPPLTNQYLNLTKNSSLAVAVGYPDVVSIANTTLNQSGRAVECIAIIMLVYLTTSLSTSLFMNWYNDRMAIKER